MKSTLQRRAMEIKGQNISDLEVEELIYQPEKG